MVPLPPSLTNNYGILALCTFHTFYVYIIHKSICILINIKDKYKRKICDGQIVILWV